MNEFEQEILNKFLVLCREDFIDSLTEDRITDFPTKYEPNIGAAPFNVYSELWVYLQNEVLFGFNKDAPFINILKDAYFYAFYSSNERSKEIRKAIEELRIDELIEKFQSDVLFGSTVIKTCIEYLFYIANDPAFISLIEEDLKQSSQKDTLEKLELEFTPLTENQLLRKMLYNLYYELERADYSEEELYEAIDYYFETGTISIGIPDKYQSLLIDGRIPEDILEKQMRLIYQTAFVGVQTNTYFVDEFDLSKYIETLGNHDLKLLQLDEVRYEIYDIFFDYYLQFDIEKQMRKLSIKDIQILQKIYPQYYLDFSPSE